MTLNVLTETGVIKQHKHTHFVFFSCLQASCRKLYGWLKVAPYLSEHAEEDEDFDPSQGIRVLGVVCSDHRNDASFAALKDGDGAMTDFMRLPGIIFSKHARNVEDKKLKVCIACKIGDSGLNKNALMESP